MNNDEAISTERCRLDLNNATISMNDAEIVLSALNDSIIHADRIRVSGDNSHYFLASGQRIEMRVTNSLLEAVEPQLYTVDAVDPGSSFVFQFNTFAALYGSIDCTSSVMRRTLLFENNIITNRGDYDVVSNGLGCTFSRTMMMPQASLPPGGVLADPQFVDPAVGDYHLKASSPAIDAASGTGLGLDLDGIQRPQGSAADLGAYERKL